MPSEPSQFEALYDVAMRLTTAYINATTTSSTASHWT